MFSYPRPQLLLVLSRSLSLSLSLSLALSLSSRLPASLSVATVEKRELYARQVFCVALSKCHSSIRHCFPVMGGEGESHPNYLVVFLQLFSASIAGPMHAHRAAAQSTIYPSAA